MKSCTLSYIEKLPSSVPAGEKRRLTDLHFRIGKSLKGEGTPTEPTFLLQNGYLRFNPRIPSVYQEQLASIDKLNTLFGGTQQAPIIFQKDLNGVPIVGVDVRPLLKSKFQDPFNFLSDQTDDSIWTGIGLNTLEAVAQTDLARSLKDFSLEQNPNGAYEYIDGLHGKLWKESVKGIREKLETYFRLIEDGAVDKPNQKEKLLLMRVHLNQLQEGEPLKTVEALSAFVIHASNWLDAIHKNYFTQEGSVLVVQKELETGISRKTGEILTPTQRSRRLQWVGKELAKAKHYLYLFDDLVKFQEGLGLLHYTSLAEKTLDLSPALTTYLDKWLNGQGISPGQKSRVNDFLAGDQFSLSGLETLLTDVLNQSKPDQSLLDSIAQIKSLSTELLTKFPGKSVDQVLKTSVEKARSLKNSLADNHYELVKNWIWPRIKAKQLGYEGDFKLTEDQIIPLLKSASEDEGIFQYGLDAPIQSSDPITAIVANILSDTLYEASRQTQGDVSYLSGIREGLNLEKKLTPEQIRQYHREITHDNVLLLKGEEGGEAGPDWEGPTISITEFGETTVLKGYTKQSFLEEYNTARFEAQQLAFQKGLTRQIDQLWDLIPKEPDGSLTLDQNGLPAVSSGLLQYLKFSAQTNPYHARVLSKVFHKDRSGNYYLLKTDIDPSEPYWLRARLKQAFQQEFYSTHTQSLAQEAKTKLYTKWGILDNGKLPGFSEEMDERIQENSSDYKVVGDPEELREQLLRPENQGWLGSYVSHQPNSTEHYIYARSTSTQGVHSWGWINIKKPGALDNVTRLYYNKYRLTSLADQYHVDKGGFGPQVAQQYSSLKANPEKWDYYQALYEMYQDGNDNLTKNRLEHGVLPQVEKLDNVELGQEGWFTRLIQWIKNHTFLSSIRESAQWVTGKQETPENYGKPTYLDNLPVKTIRPRFTKNVADTNLEQDLFRSVLMYKAGSNHYRALRNLDPQVQALRTIIKGDSYLSLQERQATGETWTRKKLGEIIKLEQKTSATRLNKKLVSFLDDIVYGDSTFASSFKLGNKEISLNTLGQKLSGFTAFSSLAWNVSSMFGNIGVGFLANYSESVKGKYYHPEDWRAAQLNYWKNVKGLIGDLSESNADNRSMLTQLALRFDAIQGEILDDQGNISRNGTTEKMMNRALFFTQSGAEHLIQTVSMEAQLRGFILPDGRRLWDTVRYQKGQPIQFEGVAEESLRQFQQQLHSVNKQLHGHYASFDKALIQRHWLGQLAMMFKKYIYSSLRYRFSGKRYDWEAGDETEGHLRAYWKQLQSEIQDQQSIWMKAAMFGNGVLVRPTLGAIDQLIAGAITRKNTQASQYLYGDDGATPETRNAAARQTAFDVLWYTLMVMVAGFVHGLDEDDDPNGVVLKNLEAFSRRMEGDLGMYLPLYAGTGTKALFSTYDKAWTLVKSPLAQLRAYDGTVALFSQLTSDIGSLEFETYTRSGPGYEKGDTKLGHKVEKSLLGPYYQILRLMNPDSQLQYLNLSRRNSQ